MRLRSLIIGCVLTIGMAACGNNANDGDRHQGDSTDMTPAPTPSGSSDQIPTSGGMDTVSGSRNNPAASAREGSPADTAGSKAGGIRNMGSDTASSKTIDTGSAGKR